MAVSRRTFMKLASAGLASATLPLIGCVHVPEQWPCGQYPTPQSPFTRTEDWYFVGVQGIYQGDLSRYRLKLRGLLERGLTLSVEELRRRYEVVTMPDTLVCVGNGPGSGLHSSAFFRGVRLAEVLEDAGLDRRAKAALIAGLDGFIAFRAPEDLLEPTTLLAFEMGPDPRELKPLPIEHGFPLRLLTPGRYGYLQAKWIDHITFVDDADTHDVMRRSLDYFDGRIQLASGFSNAFTGWLFHPGPVELLGYAYGNGTPIARIELNIDGAWQEAEIVWNTMDDEMPSFVWCLWRYVWEARPGRHPIAVRAFYADGTTQQPGRDFPYSGGSIHSITLDVEPLPS